MKDANPSSSSPQSVIQFSPSLQTKRDDGEFSQPKLFFLDKQENLWFIKDGPYKLKSIYDPLELNLPQN